MIARDWQMHVHGQASPALTHACASRDLPLHVFAWQPAAEQAGLARDAAYLVRPDTHVGWADPRPDVAALGHYLADLRR